MSRVDSRLHSLFPPYSPPLPRTHSFDAADATNCSPLLCPLLPAPYTQQDKADAMISHLASLADQRLIISFAPKTPYYSLLKRIGELFPGPSKVGGAGQRGGWWSAACRRAWRPWCMLVAAVAVDVGLLRRKTVYMESEFFTISQSRLILFLPVLALACDAV